MRIVRGVQVVLVEAEEEVLVEGTTTGHHRSVSRSSSHILRVETIMVAVVATMDTMPAVLLAVATLSSSSHQHNNSNSTTARMIMEEVRTTTLDSTLIQISLGREVSIRMTTRTRLIMDSSRPISSHRLGDIIIRAARTTTSISSSLSMSRRPTRISSSLSMIHPIRVIVVIHRDSNSSSSDTTRIILGLPKSHSMIMAMALRGQSAVLRQLSVGSMTRMTTEDRPLVRKDEDLVGTMAHQVV